VDTLCIALIDERHWQSCKSAAAENRRPCSS